MHVSGTALALFLGSWAHPAVAQEAALQTVATKLVGSQVIPGSMFGEAIDVDGDQMAIGAPDHYVPADARGSVYIFVRAGQGWSEDSLVFPLDGVLGDEFGAAVALHGDTLLVGAPSRTGPSGEFEGGAYFFTRGPGGAFAQQVKLLPPGVGSPDGFGARVALWGDLAVVLSSGNGRVFPFARNGLSQWLQEPVIAPPFVVQDVGLVGTTLIVAGTLPDGTVVAAAYERGGAGWALATTLDAGQGNFLVRMAFDGETVVLALANFLMPPQMRVFRRQTPGSWIAQQVALPAVGEQASLGTAVAVHGDRLAASLLNDPVDEFDSVLQFVPDAHAVWRTGTTLVPPGYPTDNGFGSALSTDGGTLAVGAVEDNQAGTFAGAVFVGPFSTPGPGVVPTSLTVSGAPGGELTLVWSPSCASGATDYEIYEGRLGDFSSHTSLFCTTGGATSRTFVPSPDSTYYLVVPRTGTHEGSYGRMHDGSERAPGISACLPQSSSSCE